MREREGELMAYDFTPRGLHPDDVTSSRSTLRVAEKVPRGRHWVAVWCNIHGWDGSQMGVDVAALATEGPISACGMQLSCCVCSCISGVSRNQAAVFPHFQFYCSDLGVPVKLNQYFSSEKKLLSTKGQWIHIGKTQSKSAWKTRLKVIADIMMPDIEVGLGGSVATKATEFMNIFHNISESSHFQGQSNSIPLLDIESPAHAMGFDAVNSFVEGLNEYLALTNKSSSADTAVVPNTVPSIHVLNYLIENYNLEFLNSSVDVTSVSTEEATRAAANSLFDAQLNAIQHSDEALPKMQSGVESELLPMSAVIDTVVKASKEVADVLGDMRYTISKSVTSSQEAIFSFSKEVQKSAQGSASSAATAVKNIYDSVNESIFSSIEKVEKSFDKSVSGLQLAAEKSLHSTQESALNLTSFFHMDTSENNALKKVITVVVDVTGATLVSAGKLAVEVYGVTKGDLPLDVQLSLNTVEKKILDVAGSIGSILEEAYGVITDAERTIGLDPMNPIIPLILVFGGILFAGTSYRQLRYGGYAGDLAPKSAFDLLKKERNVVLVDIRSEELQNNEGIPDLRRQARFKFANVERMEVQDSLRSILKNINDIDDILTAVIIKNLKKVEPTTKVIVMDADGSQSKKTARALKKAGIKMPYRIEGGFQSWISDGLRVKKTEPETAFSIINKETEAILEEVKLTTVEIAAIGVGTIAGIYALIEWEKMLQLIGFIALAQATAASSCNCNTNNSLDYWTGTKQVKFGNYSI
eukprot:c22564_g1_i1 orf=397-2661(-)